MNINSYDRSDDKTGPLLRVGQPVVYIEPNEERNFLFDVTLVNGKVTEVGDESFEVQWEDLENPTEYLFEDVDINSDQIIERYGRTKQIKK